MSESTEGQGEWVDDEAGNTRTWVMPREAIEVPADGTMHDLPADTDQSDRMRDHDVIGAIRLARVAAADDTSFVRILDRLLSYAGETHPRAIAPTRLLVDAITDEMGRVSVPPPV